MSSIYTFSLGSTKYQHLLFGSKEKPLLLLFTAWKGADDFHKSVAEQLSQYVQVMIIDFYGEGYCPESDEAAGKAIAPYTKDPAAMKKHLRDLTEPLFANFSCMGAIGFCFGGLAAIYLYLSGALKGGKFAAFHPLIPDNDALTSVNPSLIKDSSLLLLEGGKDPLTSFEERAKFYETLAGWDLDWETHIFGKAAHAFTHPLAHDPKKGLIFNPVVQKKSLHLMREFLSFS